MIKHVIFLVGLVFCVVSKHSTHVLERESSYENRRNDESSYPMVNMTTYLRFKASVVKQIQKPKNSKIDTPPESKIPMESTNNIKFSTKIRGLSVCPCSAGQYCLSNICTVCPIGSFCPGDSTKITCDYGKMSNEMV
jgi:hypothetical protein